MTIPTNNIVVISDTHCGCRLALCPPKFKLDDGGTYRQSALQKKIWRMWQQFWGEFVPRATRGEPFVVVHNGDAIDGQPHGSKSQISTNISDQVSMAYECLAPVVEACGGNYYHIRGTESHVGKSAEVEEILANRLGAIPDGQGQRARYDLRKTIGPKKKIVHCLHHVGSVGSQSYEAAAPGRELVESYVEAARWGYKAPAVVVRSHRHRQIAIQFPVQDVTETTETGSAWSVVTPCWQAKTPFVWRIPQGRLSVPQWGGIVVRWAEDELFVRSKVWTVAPSRAE